MASRVRDGFDFYGALSEGTGDIWTAMGAGNAAFSSTTRFSAGQSLSLATNVAPGVVLLAAPLGANSTTLYWNFAWRKATAVNGAYLDYRMKWYDGATVQCSMTLSTDGKFTFHNGDGGTILGTYTGAMAGSGTWNHFQIKLVINGSTGSFEVRKDNSSTASFLITGVNTKVTANAYTNSIVLACSGSIPDSYQIDDFWMFDDAVNGVEPTTWTGDVRAIQIVPNSDSAVAFTPSTGITNYSLVHELTNNNTDYVSGSTIGTVDEYGNPGFGTTPYGILGVTVKQTAFETGGVKTLGSRVRSGATVVDSTGKSLTTASVEYAFNQDTDPNTGVAWTAAGIAAAKFGPKVVT